MSTRDDGFETMAPGAVEPVSRAQEVRPARSRLHTRSDLDAHGDEKGEMPDSQRERAPSKKSGISLKGRAIAYLSRREHSRLELERKLAPHTENETALQQLLDELERDKWLSNERFAASLVHRRIERQGANRILQELRQHGLADDKVAQIGEQLRETESERARAVWEKKFGRAPSDPKDYARQYRFLASRGFAIESIRRILGDIPYN